MPELKLSLENFNNDLSQKVNEQTKNIEILTKDNDSKALTILEQSKSIETLAKNEKKVTEDARVMTAKIQLLEKDIDNKDSN